MLSQIIIKTWKARNLLFFFFAAFSLWFSVMKFQHQWLHERPKCLTFAENGPTRIDSPLISTQLRKVAFMTASYKMSQYLSLWKSLEAVREICNAGFDVTIFIQAALGIQRNSTVFHQLTDSLYCARTGKLVDIHLDEFHDIGFGLNSKHRPIMLKVLREFDLFIYAEEDMVVTANHVISYLNQLSLFQHDFPDTWSSYFPGFLR
jgi:hypothetical protein